MFVAGQGSKRSAAQASLEEAATSAVPSIGRPQRASQRSVHNAAAVSSRHAVEKEINLSVSHLPCACSVGLSAIAMCRLVICFASGSHSHMCSPRFAGLHKLFQPFVDGFAAIDALQEYRSYRKAPAALITVSALNNRDWSSMTDRELELLRPVLLASECIFDPACKVLFATRLGVPVPEGMYRCFLTSTMSAHAK